MENNLWYRSAGEGWSPTLYDWFFHKTRRGLSLRRGEEEVVYRLLDGSLGPESRVVEYGPGTGHYTVPLARRCGSVVAVEPSAEMREHLRARLRREGVTNVEVRGGVIEAGPDPADPFDGSLAIGPLYYVRDLRTTLQRMGAGLKPGGWAVFSVPLLSLEGCWQQLSELLARRRAFLRTPAETALEAGRAGLEVRDTGLTGTTKTGLSLVLKVVRASPADPGGT
jgi:SAM-dependent methyltransferase